MLMLGNLDNARDWGFAGDYVEAMWLMLQQEEAEDFVIATGQQYSVRDFINAAANALDMSLEWRGNGIDEVAYWANSSENHSKTSPVVVVDPAYFRPAEVETLIGDATKAREKLGWEPKTSFFDMVEEMVQSDFREAETESRISNWKHY